MTVYISDPRSSLAGSGTELDIDEIDFYTDDKLWEETNCPSGTQFLTKEVYDRVNLGEFWNHDLEDQLTARNIKFVETGSLAIETQWECDDEPYTPYFYCIMYSYKGYTYLIKFSEIDGCSRYIMTREPELNKKSHVDLYKRF